MNEREKIYDKKDEERSASDKALMQVIYDRQKAYYDDLTTEVRQTLETLNPDSARAQELKKALEEKDHFWHEFGLTEQIFMGVTLALILQVGVAGHQEISQLYTNTVDMISTNLQLSYLQQFIQAGNLRVVQEFITFHTEQYQTIKMNALMFFMSIQLIIAMIGTGLFHVTRRNKVMARRIRRLSKAHFSQDKNTDNESLGRRLDEDFSQQDIGDKQIEDDL